jgi:hypothetical protein
MSLRDFHNAVKCNDVKSLKQLMLSVPELINEPNEGGVTVLDHVLYKGNTKSFVAFFKNEEARKRINEYIFCGNTPLTYLSRHGKFLFTEFLLEYGANPDVVDKQGKTSLDYAIQPFNRKVVEILVRFGADLHCIAPDIDVLLKQWLKCDKNDFWFDETKLHRNIVESFQLETRFLRICRFNTAYAVANLLQLGAITPDSTVSRAKEVASRNETHVEEMQRLVVLVCGGWSRCNHYLYSQSVKDAVCTTLLVASRFESEAELVDEPELEILPDELWKVIFSFFLRSDWLVVV